MTVHVLPDFGVPYGEAGTNGRGSATVTCPVCGHVTTAASPKGAAQSYACHFAHEAFRTLVRAIGGGFHPDTRGADYISLPEPYTPADVDRTVEAALAAGVDVYGEALDLIHEDDLEPAERAARAAAARAAAVEAGDLTPVTCRRCGDPVSLTIGLPVSVTFSADHGGTATIETDVAELAEFGLDDLTCLCTADGDPAADFDLPDLTAEDLARLTVILEAVRFVAAPALDVTWA